MFRILISHLQDKPEAGLAGTGGSFIAGIIPTAINITRDDVMFWFQILAFTATILAGLATAYAQILKTRKLKKGKDNDGKEA